MRLCRRCFPVNIEKFSRAPFLQNTFGQLLLNAYLTYGNIGMKNCKFAGIISVFQTMYFFYDKMFTISVSGLHESSHCQIYYFEQCHSRCTYLEVFQKKDFVVKFSQKFSHVEDGFHFQQICRLKIYIL